MTISLELELMVQETVIREQVHGEIDGSGDIINEGTKHGPLRHSREYIGG